MTSEATTANPLPASPARAASIVAFNAKRLVWLAMSLIILTTSPMLWAASANPWISSLVRLVSSTARAVISDEVATWRLISAIEDDNSSAAEATVWTLLAACSDAAATVADCRSVSSAVADIDCAVA